MRAAAARSRRLLDPRLPAYAAILLGVVVRCAYTFRTDFPLNDGGLFYRMVEDIQAAHYHLPAFTTYNNESIPFAYSPLAFYVAAVLNDALGIPLIQLFRFLPLVATCLVVVAFYHLARVMVPGRWRVAAAVLAFALVPRSFVWLLMGGGLTRSVGFLCAVVALQQVYRLYTERHWRFAATATVACALTVVSHLSTAQFLAASIALFFLFYGRHLHGLVSSAAIAVGTVVLSAPWWGTVIAQHGVAPFLAAQTVSGSVFSDPLVRYEVMVRLANFNSYLTGETLFPLIAMLALLGSFASLRPDRIILPLWWVLINVLDPRAGMTYSTLPVAMLAGIAVIDLLVPALQGFYANTGTHPTWGRVAPLLRYAPVAVLSFLLAYGIGAALTRNHGGETPTLTALTPADREAMAWVTRHTPRSSRFLVLTGEVWSRDKVAEWFPALTRRESVATVQGAEWLPGFRTRQEATDDKLQGRCRIGTGFCLSAWADSSHTRFDHVYVVKRDRFPCCTTLVDALRHDPSYAVLYDGPAALIAERRGSAGQPAVTSR